MVEKAIILKGRSFHEKIAFGSFANNAYITFSGNIWSNNMMDYSRPFKEAVVVNNLDKDVAIYTAEDSKNPITTIKASGGSFVFSKEDLLGTYYPLLVRNESGAAATSGNVVLTMVR